MNVSDLANDLVNELKKLSIDEPMWSVKHIADYMNVSESTVRNRVIVHRLFPVSVRVPYNKGSKTDPRWYPNEVKAFLSKNRSKK